MGCLPWEEGPAIGNWRTIKVSKTLEEVWRWKEEVAREIEGMTAEGRIAYFRQANRRLEEKTAKKLHLPRGTSARK